MTSLGVRISRIDGFLSVFFAWTTSSNFLCAREPQYECSTPIQKSGYPDSIMPRLPLLSRLAQDVPLISDGATGTYLQMHGLEPGGCPEAFNSEHPDIVRGMSAAYSEAGSEMVLTNSFGGNRFMLKKYGYGDQLHRFNRLAAQLAREGAGEDCYVVGSIGPTGEFVEPLGEVTEREMFEAFAEQAAALAEGGADAILAETMTAVEEATLAIQAAKETTGLPVLVSMTFDKGPRGYFTMMGVSPEQAVLKLRAAGADVVGTNCGNGIERMVEISDIMRDLTDQPLVVHSNAGIPKLVDMKIVYDEEPLWMAKRFRLMADMGIKIIGGCCGTTPEHIRELVKAVRPAA